MELNEIDVTFDVRTDSRGKDPDWASETMKVYHQLLWSKPLPNGQTLQLESGGGCYLKGNGVLFGSDSIAATFRNGRNRHLDEFKAAIPNYVEYERQNLSKLYTIGGSIIFPQTPWSMNRARGCHPRICDRWDLTLECIRRFYEGESSPLEKSILESKIFFEWFVDFKGYVDFFLLQDCVDEAYNVKSWMDSPLFESYPIPQDIETYQNWVNTQLNFVERRNWRIKEYCQIHQLCIK